MNSRTNSSLFDCLSTVCESSFTGSSYTGVKRHNSAGCVTNISIEGLNIGLTWNSQYQLTAVSTNGVECERNGYDGMGRRVWSWDPSTGSGQAETNYYVYDGAQIIADVDATGGLRRSYVWGPGIDNLLAMTVYTGATVKTYYYLTDHLGTVHAVSDETGTIVESYRYDAWGRVLGVCNGSGTPLAESAIGNKILWQGREYSWKTGLYFFRLRWYDPITGKWLSNDPIGISGGLNQYVFCANNPVNYRDPFGLQLTEADRKAIEGQISFINDLLQKIDSPTMPMSVSDALGELANKYPGAKTIAHVEYKGGDFQTVWDITEKEKKELNTYVLKSYEKHECAHKAQYRKLMNENENNLVKVLGKTKADERALDVDAYKIQKKYLQRLLEAR